MSELSVAIIIIEKNESEVIESCLDSIFSQSVKPDEVIVVDGRSTDDTLEKVSKYPAKIVVEEGDTSPSNARNLGVKTSTADIVLVMGADAELGADCVKNSIKYFKDPNIMVVIPALDIRVHTRLEEIQKAWFWGSRSSLRTPYGTGSSIQFIRRKVYLEIQFDNKFGYGDDSDFRRRMLKIYDGSSSIIRAEDVKILVDLPHTYREVATQFRWYGRTSLRYYRRYHNIGAIIRLINVLLPVFFISSLFLIPFIPYSNYLSGFVLFIIFLRYFIFCVRSNTLYLVNFLIYDFYRSYHYLWGIIQGLFINKTGR